jgi:WD40 repeat protein
LISGSVDGTIKIWDFENGTVKKSINVEAIVCSLELLSNGDLVCGTVDGQVKIFE